MRVLRIFTKLLVLLLVFVIGFLSSFGAIAGAAFIFYEKGSIDALNELGFNIDISKAVNTDKAQENGGVSLTSLTLKGLIEEIKKLKEMGDEVTTQLLVDRYGLILAEEVEIILNDEVRLIPLADIISGEGLSKMLRTYSIGETVFGYEQIPNPDHVEGDSNEPYIWVDDDGNPVTGLNAILANYTFDQFAEGDFNLIADNLLNEITVASILNLTCQSDLPVYTEDGTEMTTITVPVWFDKAGAPADKIMSAVADSNVVNVGNNIQSLPIASFLGYVKDETTGTYYSWEVKDDGDGQRVVVTPQDGLVTDFSDLSVDGLAGGKLDDKITSIEVHKVLGFTYNEETKKYTDKDGKDVTGIMAVLAGNQVGELGSGVGEITVGEVAGYTPVEVPAPTPEDPNATKTVWYEVYDEENHENDKLATGILADLANVTVNQMTTEGDLSAEIQKLQVANVLGYTKVGDDYYKNGDLENGVPKPDAKPLTGVMAVLIKYSVGEIGDEVGNIQVGEIAGYTPVEEPAPTDEDPNATKTVWYDENGKVATGILADLADLTVDELSKEDSLSAEIKGLNVASVLGYTLYEGKYYLNGDIDENGVPNPEAVELKGVMAVIMKYNVGELGEEVGNIKVGEVAGYTPIEEPDPNDPEKTITVWYEVYDEENPENNKKATGILASLADLTVDQMSDNDELSNAIQDIYVYDVLGYKQHTDGKYYKNADFNEDGTLKSEAVALTGVMAVIMNFKVGELGDEVGNIKVGEVAGYTETEELDEHGNIIWLTPEGEKATGILAALANLTVDEMSNEDSLSGEIQKINVNDVLGYKLYEGSYYKKECFREDGSFIEGSEPLGGVMAVIMKYKVGDLGDEVGNIRVGEVAGYTPVDAEGNVITDNALIDKTTLWYQVYDKETPESNKEATGILASLAYLTVDDMSNEDKLSEAIQDIHVYDVLGYKQHTDGKYYKTSDFDDEGNLIGTPDPLSGVMAVLIDDKVGDIGDNVGKITVGEVAGYTPVDAEGNVITDNTTITKNTLWYSEYYGVASPDNKPASGILASLAYLTVDDMSNEDKLSEAIQDIHVYDVLGYKQHTDGKYYKTSDFDDEGNLIGTPDPLSGVMAVLIDDKVGDIGDNVGKITVGEVAGYTPVDADGNVIEDMTTVADNAVITWYVGEYNKGDTSNNKKAEGILAALADLSVDEMSDEKLLSEKIQTIQVKDVLGYTKVDKKFYHSTDVDEDGNVIPGAIPVTGVMALIAETNVGGIQEELNDSYMGDILGFVQQPHNDGTGEKDMWFDKDDLNNPVHVLMQTVASTKLAEIGGITNTLKIADLIPANERTGFISLLDEDTALVDNPETLDKDESLANQVNVIFNEKTIQDFIDCGALNLSETNINKLEKLGLMEVSISNMISTLLDLVPALP